MVRRGCLTDPTILLPLHLRPERTGDRGCCMCPMLYPQYMQGSAVCTLLRSQYSQHPRKSDAAVFSLLPSVGSTKNAVDRRMEAPWKHQIWRRGRYLPSHPHATHKRRGRMSISDLLLLLEQDVLSQLHSWRHLPPTERAGGLA
jgi:hypothetical protein